MKLSRFVPSLSAALALCGLGLTVFISQSSAAILADPPALNAGRLALLEGSGGRLLGSTCEDPIRLRNTGREPVVFLEALVEGETGPCFTVAGCPARGERVPPGGTVAVVVRSQARVPGPFSATLVVRSGGEETRVPLAAEVVELSLGKNPVHMPSLSFGAVPATETSGRRFGFANVGSVPVRVSEIAATGEGFTASDSPVPQGNVVPPGFERLVQLDYYAAAPHQEAGGFVTTRIDWDGTRSTNLITPLRATTLDTIRVLGMTAMEPGVEVLVVSARPEELASSRLRKLCVAGRREDAGYIGYYQARKSDLNDLWTISRGFGFVTPSPVIAGMALRKKKIAPEGTLPTEELWFLGVERPAAYLYDSTGVRIATLNNGKLNTGVAARSQIDTDKAFMIQRDMMSARTFLTRVRMKKADELEIRYLESRAYSLSALLEPRIVERIRRMRIVPVCSYGTNAIPTEHAVLVARVREDDGGGGQVTKKRIIDVAGLRAAGIPTASTLTVDAMAEVMETEGNVKELAAGMTRKKIALACRTEIDCALSYESCRVEARTVSCGPHPWDVIPGANRQEEKWLAAMRMMPYEKTWLFGVCGDSVLTRAHLYRVESDTLVARAAGSLSPNPPVEEITLMASRKECVVAAKKAAEESASLMIVDSGLPAGTNRAPIVDAGADGKDNDCDGNGSEIVMLEALASDPDGDPLLYSWTAPGIVFDDPTSRTPSASFPVGVTPVYVAVEDIPPEGMEPLVSLPDVMVVSVQSASGLPQGPAPAELGLAAPQPNPFTARTTVSFSLPRPGRIELTIHDAQGARVSTLESGDLPAGVHERTWDGRNAQGTRVAAGHYFFRLQVGEETRSRAVLLVR